MTNSSTPWYARLVAQVFKSWWFGVAVCVALAVWVIQNGMDHRIAALLAPVTEFVAALNPFGG